MIEAYVLIQTEIGEAGRVVVEVLKIPAVTTAVSVTGPYDVLAHIAAPDMDALGKVAASEIQGVEGVFRTVTCPVVHF